MVAVEVAVIVIVEVIASVVVVVRDGNANVLGTTFAPRALDGLEDGITRSPAFRSPTSDGFP